MIYLINGDLINAPRQGIGPDHALRGWDAGIDQYCRRKWRPQTTKKTQEQTKKKKHRNWIVFAEDVVDVDDGCGVTDLGVKGVMEHSPAIELLYKLIAR